MLGSTLELNFRHCISHAFHPLVRGSSYLTEKVKKAVLLPFYYLTTLFQSCLSLCPLGSTLRNLLLPLLG